MGTQLDFFSVNPLASTSKESSSNYKYSTAQYSCIPDWDHQPVTSELNLHNKCHQRSGLKKVSGSMDRARLEKHKIESIRKTMQAQEEVFKHQLRELHRLYSVQKMLMEEMKRETKQKRHWSAPHGSGATLMNQQYYSRYPNNQTLNLTPQAAAAASTVFGFNNYLRNLSPRAPAERSTGSCSAEPTMRSRTSVLDLDLERPAAPDHEDLAVDHDDRRARRPDKMTVDRSSDDAEESNTDVELTLSIGLSSSSSKSNHKTSNKESVMRDLDSPASFRSENNQECSGQSTPMSSSSMTLDQDRKKPCWLFQGLSINRSN